MFNHSPIHQVLLENAYFALNFELEEQKYEMHAICQPDFLPVAYSLPDLLMKPTALVSFFWEADIIEAEACDGDDVDAGNSV